MAQFLFTIDFNQGSITAWNIIAYCVNMFSISNLGVQSFNRLIIPPRLIIYPILFVETLWKSRCNQSFSLKQLLLSSSGQTLFVACESHWSYFSEQYTIDKPTWHFFITAILHAECMPCHSILLVFTILNLRTHNFQTMSFSHYCAPLALNAQNVIKKLFRKCFVKCCGFSSGSFVIMPHWKLRHFLWATQYTAESVSWMSIEPYGWFNVYKEVMKLAEAKWL